MKRLTIPDDLFWVVRGASGACGVFVLLFQVRDGGELVSGERVSIRVGQKGREDIAEGGRGGSFGRECMLKGDRHWQVEGRERLGCDG